MKEDRVVLEKDRWGDWRVVGGHVVVELDVPRCQDTLFEHTDYGFPDGEKAV